MDATLPGVSITIGVLLLGEHVRTGPLALTCACLGLTALLAGIITLDTSPLIRRQQNIEHECKDDTARQEQEQQENS